MIYPDILTMEELTSVLARTVSCGGNLLMNVGPTSQGTIDTIFEERLRQVGLWLKVNGEGIYGSRPWLCQNDTANGNVWYTSRTDHTYGTVVYGFVTEWPANGHLQVRQSV